eukprot:1239457-Rhodomonas_salina.1
MIHEFPHSQGKPATTPAQPPNTDPSSSSSSESTSNLKLARGASGAPKEEGTVTVTGTVTGTQGTRASGAGPGATPF